MAVINDDISYSQFPVSLFYKLKSTIFTGFCRLANHGDMRSGASHITVDWVHVSDNHPRSKMDRILRTGLYVVGMSVGSLLATSTPALSAEEIQFRYGPIQMSVSVDSLESFVNEGTIEPDLKAYTKRFSEQELNSIRKTLQAPVEIEHIALTNFLYTPQGEAILRRLGDVIRTQSNPGFFALRASLILASREEGNATPIRFLKEFPTHSIVIDVDRGLEILRELDQLTNVTSDALNLIETQYRAGLSRLVFGTASSSIYTDTDNSFTLEQPGPYSWNESTLKLENTSGDRRPFQVDFYLPDTNEPAPLAIISHGLGSDRTSYRYLAEHLASHGFAVASPEHPGSNADYVQALFEGAAEQISEPEEFIDRAQDISFILDQLAVETRNEEWLINRLDLNRIGVIGQSFGGYTALSLGGAEINFARLRSGCPNGNASRDTLNLSLLLQCRASALDISNQSLSENGMLSLRDERVKAIMAINPIGSRVFGQEGLSQIEIPTMIVTASSDVIAPTLFEQIFPFTWLNVDERYLVLMRKATHFSTIGRSANSESEVELPTAIVGPAPQLAQNYMKTMSVAFLKSHLTDEDHYQGYLTPNYISSISRDPLPLSIIDSLSEDQITQLVKDTVFIISALQ